MHYTGNATDCKSGGVGQRVCQGWRTFVCPRRDGCAHTWITLDLKNRDRRHESQIFPPLFKGVLVCSGGCFTVGLRATYDCKKFQTVSFSFPDCTGLCSYVLPPFETSARPIQLPKMSSCSVASLGHPRHAWSPTVSSAPHVLIDPFHFFDLVVRLRKM